MRRQRGIALILAIGVLAILTTIATTFALNMRLEYKTAVNYYNGVKSRYIADAAFQKAIAQLRQQVKTNAFDSLASSSSDVTTPDGLTHAADAIITDEQGKLNINNCSVSMLENLIDILINKESLTTLSKSDASGIIARRPPSGYLNLQDIIVKAKNADPAFDEEKIALLKPDITTRSYEDPNNSDRSPINVNTASQALIAAVLMTDSALNMNTAGDVAGELISFRLTSWSEFNNTINGVIDEYITSSQAATINDNCNPNRGTGTTKFCFCPGGYYNISAIGTAYDRSGAAVGTETISAIVKINEIYTETTKEQFEDGSTDDTTTFLDSCPDSPEDSIKLGFWDDFDERLSDDALFSLEAWGGVIGSSDISDADGDGNNELVSNSYGLFPVPGDWSDFYFSGEVTDLSNGYQMKDVPQVIFRGDTLIGDPTAIFARQGPLEWGGAWAYEIGDNIEFLTDSDARDYGFDPATDKYIYDGQIRIWPDSNQDTDADRTLIDYDPSKTIEITANGSQAAINVGGASLARGGVVDRSGSIALYSHAIRVAWDNVRIIGPSGSFTSDTFSPPEGRVEWGTITGTIKDPLEGEIAITAIGQGFYSSSANLNSTSPFAAIEATSDSISWEALFSQYPEDISHEGCPVLEDVTITYLPETEIQSYTFR